LITGADKGRYFSTALSRNSHKREATENAWSQPKDFIFPNSKGGFLDYENFEARVLDPIRQKLGLEKLNFQILRDQSGRRAHGDGEGCAKAAQAREAGYNPGELCEAHPGISLCHD
jgi:hypothetical protein